MSLKNISGNCADCNACRAEKTAGLKIAVFGNESEFPASSHTADRLVIYGKQNGAWERLRTEEFPLMAVSSPAGMRASAEGIVGLIGDCSVIAGASVSGVAFSVFDKHGKHIFEIPEVSQEQLTGIAEDVAHADAKSFLDSQIIESAVPTETETPGVYTVDLAAIQKQYPELSSKMILKQFLKSAPFYELRITCSHVPVWLERETGFRIMQKREKGCLIVLVVKETCQE